MMGSLEKKANNGGGKKIVLQKKGREIVENKMVRDAR